VAGLFGNQRQQQQFQVTGGKDPWPASAAFATGAAFETVMAIAEFAGMVTMGRRLLSHFTFSCLIKIYLKIYLKWATRKNDERLPGQEALRCLPRIAVGFLFVPEEFPYVNRRKAL